jgi:uncharacterized PurR-regulated membrane protein YhhQ (DUF165 family)
MFIEESNNRPEIMKRRERVFLIMAGIFLGSLTMLNILGTSKFIDYSFHIGQMEIPFVFAVGVLPYPITFLCTDLISELYGHKRANLLVWVGLMLNAWVFFVLWLGGALDPPAELNEQGLIPITAEGAGRVDVHQQYSFYYIRSLTKVSVFASMIAYLLAQFTDVKVFHFLKDITKGKHLWLRNNGSTLISQMVDSFAVIFITYAWASYALPLDFNKPIFGQLLILVFSAYIFKLVIALLDTIPFYILTKWLSKYLEINPSAKYYEDLEKEKEEIKE